MKFEGLVWQDGDWWLAEIPLLDVTSQGSSEEEARSMIKDAVESLVDRKGFVLDVKDKGAGRIEVSSNDSKILVAFMLKRQREKNGLTLAQVAESLGQTSRNAYARYERGEISPTLDKLCELLRSVNPDHDLVLGISR